MCKVRCYHEKVILLPFGDQRHIRDLLSRLAELVAADREENSPWFCPAAISLHQYRQQLVPKASRRLNLLTFDDLVASAMAAVPGVTGISGSLATEIIREILGQKAGELPALGSLGAREIAAELTYALGQLRREKLVPSDLESNREAQVVTDLAAVWREYLAYLRNNRLADIEHQYALAVEAMSNLPWLAQVRQLHLCWFFDFEPLQQDILRAVSAVVPRSRCGCP